MEAGRQNERVEARNGRIRKHRVMQCPVVFVFEEQPKRMFVRPTGIAAGTAVNAQAGIHPKARAAVRHDEFRRSRTLPRGTIGVRWVRVGVYASVLTEDAVRISDDGKSRKV